MKEVHCPVRPSGGKSIPFEQEPRLTCISRTLPESPPPWTLHSHDDLCELVLICEGEADYSISGQEHHVRRGDLIIYNSGVVHDERSGTSMPVSSYCCSMTGLKLHGLRENAFLPDGACPVFPSGAHFEALRDTLSIIVRRTLRRRGRLRPLLQLPAARRPQPRVGPAPPPARRPRRSAESARQPH